MRVVAVLLVLLLLPALRGPLHAAEGGDVLRALADEEAEGHEAALEAWEAWGEARQIRVLREALLGEDEHLARIAARALGPAYLAGGELLRQSELRRRDDPQNWARVGDDFYDWAPDSGLSFGGPDVVPFFEAAVADPDLHPEPDMFEQVHRAAYPDHLPDLISLLERGTPEVFRNLLWLVDLLATYDTADRHRPLLVRAFLYARARLDAEAAGEPRPRLADVEVELEREGGGLPAAFVLLIEDPVVHRLGWPRRWARDLVPGAQDVALLERLAAKRDSYLPFWALRHLVRIGTPDAIAFVEDVARREGHPATRAAGALLEGGRPEAWAALSEDEAQPVGWAVDPRRAREAWLREPSRELEPAGRLGLEVFDGIRVRPGDLLWLAERILEPRRSAVSVARFFSDVYPEGLTAARATLLAKRLRDVPEDSLRELDLDRVLGLLEVAAPDDLQALLERWSAKYPWVEAYRWKLGVVPDREVLLRRWRDGDEDESAEALVALAIRDGLPARVARSEFGYYEGPEDEELREAVEREIVVGDPIAAVLRLHEAEASIGTVVTLGLIDDPRARALLRRYREQRHLELYWPATAGLALAGDEQVREEFLGLLADDRTFFLDGLADQTLALSGDLALAPVWIAKLDHNCCTAFHAHTALKQIFPTLPYEHHFAMPLRDAVRAWYDRGLSCGFAWSRILGGWVPRPAPE